MKILANFFLSKFRSASVWTILWRGEEVSSRNFRLKAFELFIEQCSIWRVQQELRKPKLLKSKAIKNSRELPLETFECKVWKTSKQQAIFPIYF